MRVGTVLWYFILLVFGSALVSTAKADDNPNPHVPIYSSGQVVPVAPTGSVSQQLLVSLANGHLVALDEQTGDLQWTFDTGSPLLTSANPAAAAAAAAPQGPNDAQLPSLKEGIFPGTDGSLYIYRPQKFGPPRIEKLPIGVKDLVDISPAPTPDGSLVLGSQRSTVFVLDAARGTLLRTLRGSDSDAEADLLADPAVLGDPGTNTGGGGGGVGAGIGPILAIGRKDYVIRSVHPAFGEQWNVSWSSLQHLSSLAVRRPGAGASSASSSSSGAGGAAAPGGIPFTSGGGAALPAGSHDMEENSLELVVGPDHSLRRLDKENRWVVWYRKFEAPPLAAYPSNGPPVDLVNAFEPAGKKENPPEGSSSSGGLKVDGRDSGAAGKALTQLPNQGSTNTDALMNSSDGGKESGNSGSSGVGSRQPAEALVVGVMRGGLFGMKIPAFAIPGSNAALQDRVENLEDKEGLCDVSGDKDDGAENVSEGNGVVSGMCGMGPGTARTRTTTRTNLHVNGDGGTATSTTDGDYEEDHGGVLDEEDKIGMSEFDPDLDDQEGTGTEGDGTTGGDRDVDLEDLDDDDSLSYYDDYEVDEESIISGDGQLVPLHGTGLALPTQAVPWWRESVCQSQDSDSTSTCAVPLGLFQVEEQSTDSSLVYIPESSTTPSSTTSPSTANGTGTANGTTEIKGGSSSSPSWIGWLVIQYPIAAIVIFVSSGGVLVWLAALVLRIGKTSTKATTVVAGFSLQAMPEAASGQEAAASRGKKSGKKSKKKGTGANRLSEDVTGANTEATMEKKGAQNESNNSNSSYTTNSNAAGNGNSLIGSSSNNPPPSLAPDSTTRQQQQQQRSTIVDGVTYVGRLRVGPGILGYGSGGTIVFEGELDGRHVAVKRLLRQFVELAKKEIGALIVSDEHPNVVRCFAMEEDAEFVYLALERCTCTLADAMSTPSGKRKFVQSDGQPTPFAMQVCEDVGRGLAALHARGIVHRDLKPHNVLLSESGRAKLSDMGLSKTLVPEQASFETVGAGGSPGWQAPEQLALRAGNLGARQTAGVDVFSFGLLIHYCLTGGKHPFGEGVERDAAILRNRRNLDAVKSLPEAADLLAAMLAATPEARPSVEAAMTHPLWWSVARRLAFLIHVSDRVEGEDRAGDGTMYASLEALSLAVVGEAGNWGAVLDPGLISNLGKYRRYDFSSLRDLLRVVRNKHSHFRELPPDLQARLGPIPDGFLAYFAARFPRLLVTCFYFALRWCLTEPIFIKYFPQGASGLLSTSAPLEIRDPKVEAAAIEAAKLRLAAAAAEIRQQRVTAEALGGNGESKTGPAPTAGAANIALPAEPVAPPVAVHYDPATGTSIVVFPRRHGAPPCDFYVKTGHCRYGETCRFDHPPEYSVRLNAQGLPIRPGQTLCTYYERNGECKFGPACRFHHPQTLNDQNLSTGGGGTATPGTSATLSPGAPPFASPAGVVVQLPTVVQIGGGSMTMPSPRHQNQQQQEQQSTPGLVVDSQAEEASAWPSVGASTPLSPTPGGGKIPQGVWGAEVSTLGNGNVPITSTTTVPSKDDVSSIDSSDVPPPPSPSPWKSIVSGNGSGAGLTPPPGFKGKI